MPNRTPTRKKAEYTLAHVQALYDDADGSWSRRREWRTIEAIAFFRGLQYTLRAPKNVNQPFEDQRDEAAEVVNICRPIVNASVAAILSQLPNPKIAPLKGNPQAAARAKMAESLASGFARNGVIDQYELHEAVLWSRITGGAWFKTFWDPDAGRHLPDTFQTGLEGSDPYGTEDKPLAMQVREGEIATEFVNTIDGLPDPSAHTPKQVKYFVHRKIRTVSDLTDSYPVDWFGEPTRRGWDVGTSSTSQAALRNIVEDDTEALGSAGANQSSESNTLAEICEFWALPSRKFPYGLLVIWSGTMLLHVGPNPLVPARLPFTLLVGPNKSPGTLYADGILEDIKHLQRVVNQVETKKIEIINKAANPHILVPHGSGIVANTWGNIPGQIIPYTRGHLPTMLPPVEVPQSLFQHTADQIDRSKFLTGHSDLAQGNVAAETAGRTVAFASENAQRARAPETTGHRNSIINVFQQCLWLARQFYDEGRLVRTVGEENELEMQEFQSEEYDFENEFLPEPFSDEPTTHSARVATAIELNGAGFFNDDPAAERMRRTVGGTFAKKGSYDPFQADRDRAKREHLYVIRDPLNIPGIRMYDIHRIHLEEHNEFRKTAQYEALPTHVQAAFDAHCDAHELADYAAKLAMMPGAGGGEKENMLGPPPTPPQPGQLPPGPEGAPPGVPSPPNGGADLDPAPAPSVQEFAQMSESEQRATDQR